MYIIGQKAARGSCIPGTLKNETPGKKKKKEGPADQLHNYAEVIPGFFRISHLVPDLLSSVNLYLIYNWY